MTPDEISELEDRATYHPERITPEDLDRMRTAFGDIGRVIERDVVPFLDDLWATIRTVAETVAETVASVFEGWVFDPEADLRERAIEQGITEVDIRSVDVETQTVRLWNRLVYEVDR